MLANRPENLKRTLHIRAVNDRSVLALTFVLAMLSKALSFRSQEDKDIKNCLEAVIKSLRSTRKRPTPGSNQREALASATVSAVMLTMRLTVADGVRMCAGLAAPSRTGPMAMPPPAADLSRL